MGYADNIKKPPRTLLDSERKALLQVSGEHAEGFRDHVIFSIALGTAMREHEILALNVGDVTNETGGIREKLTLKVFKRSRHDKPETARSKKTQVVFVPRTLQYKLAKFLRWKKHEKQDLSPGAPLFMSREGARMSGRRLRAVFHDWQRKAGFETVFKFHALRHTSLTNLFKESKDIRVVQAQARHASIVTTSIYVVPTDQDVSRAVRGLDC